MPQSLVRNAGLFVLRYQRIVDRNDDILTKSQRALYDEMTNRRTQYRKVGTLNIAGWAFQFGDPVKFIAFENSLGEIEASTDRLSEGPDIVERFASDGEVPLRSHFVLSVDLFRTDGLKGDLVFITQRGAEFREKATTVLSGGAPAGNGNALMCHIDSQEQITSPADLSDAFANFIGNYHRFLVIGLSVAGLAAALMITLRFRHLRANDPLNATLILLAATVFLRVLFFTFLDATWWESGYERYLLPVMPLYSCFLILLIYQSFALWRQAGKAT